MDATPNMKVENNKVYILPPGFYMTIKDGRLHLHKRTGPLNCAIDIFMESLAKEYKGYAIGIILSGTGANGTKGIEHIKKEGGKVFVQAPRNASYDRTLCRRFFLNGLACVTFIYRKRLQLNVSFKRA
jgi:two-component system CheB/CheR fusion protein